MARIVFTGLDGYMKQLEALGKSSAGMAKKAVFNGSGVVADEIRRGINWIDPGSEDKETAQEYDRRIKQIDGLKNGLGISEIRDDGGVINAIVGFNGYNDVHTPKFPNGQPNKMVARIFNSGTSHNKKQPFFDIAVKEAKKKAEAKMKEVFESEIEKIMKG